MATRATRVRAGRLLPIRAQDLPTSSSLAGLSTYPGKVLRLNQDGTAGGHPLIRGVRSHIFSYGHRDPDGLAFGGTGSCTRRDRPEERRRVNCCAPGRTTLAVCAGYRDTSRTGNANWSAARLGQLGVRPMVAPPRCPGAGRTQWDNRTNVEPLKTLFTVPNGYNFQDPACGPGFARCGRRSARPA